jgi:hypothetical protein
MEQAVRRSITAEENSSGPVVVRQVTGVASWIANDREHHILALPWLGSRSRWQVTITSREQGAPITAAQFLVAVDPTGITAHTLWNTGAKAVPTVGRSSDGQIVQLFLDTRQFGAAPPHADVIAHA